jgi:transcriptional regulator with XRE-family HTH domain
MGTSLDEILSKLPAERRTKIEQRAAQLVNEEMTLRDLRLARKLTQERMAELLNIRQESVSRLEKRSDLLLSTLRGYIQAMGGQLDLVVRFPDLPPVNLSGISEEAELDVTSHEDVADPTNVEAMTIPATTVPAFSAGKGFKDKVAVS